MLQHAQAAWGVRRCACNLAPTHLRCIEALPLPSLRREVAAHAKPSRRSSRQKPQGFGLPETALKDLETAEDDDDSLQNLVHIPCYAMYSDAEYNPNRVLGPIEVAAIPGKGNGLVTTEAVTPGDLLFMAPAVAFLPGEWQQAPEPEELHMSLMESGLTAAQRRVLDQLHDGTSPSSPSASSTGSKEASISSSASDGGSGSGSNMGSSEGSSSGDSSSSKAVAEPSAGSQARPPPSLATLDPKFWASRGRHDPQAPVISSGRLLGIIQSCACSDLQQDGPAMTLRTQKPVGFIGVWAEFALMNHSCAPNTAIAVVQDRMLVHAGRDLEQGEELTRSYLPTASMTAPAPQRQAALDEAGWGGWRCSCPRCTLEAAISPDLQELLQSAHAWYTEEALPRWVESNRREDIHMLAELYEEASLLVNELEEAVTAEPDLSDWERDLLRASAYDCYDMLVLCDEYVNKENASPVNLLCCLTVLAALVPGSEAHVGLAHKYELLLQERYDLMRTAVRAEAKRGGKVFDNTKLRNVKRMLDEVELAKQYSITAMVTRYGLIQPNTLSGLSDAVLQFEDAQEQWSVMQSEGKQESVKEMEINGVRVSVVDRFDLASDADDPTVAGSYTLHSEITPEDTAGRSATQAGALRAAESAGAIVGQGLPENEDEDEEDGWLQDVEVLEGLSSPVAAGP
ncbi:hypothetical protein V8C86DRAFT_2583575 [Haematococcus lacustris]